MGGPEMAPHTPQTFGRQGYAVAQFDVSRFQRSVQGNRGVGSISKALR